MNSNGAPPIEELSIDQLDAELDRGTLLTPARVLELLTAAERLCARAHAARARAIALAEKLAAAEQQHLCSTATYLASEHRHTGRQVRHLVAEARDLARFPRIVAAFQTGHLSPAPVSSILINLTSLPENISTGEFDQAQDLMVSFAETNDPAALRTLSRVLRETIDPEGADRDEAARLAAEERLAHQNRRLTLTPDGLGAMLLAGRLPLADGEELRALLEAHTQSIWAHNAEQRPGHQVPMAKAQVRADALMLLVRRASRAGTAPRHGGDRPRITVLTTIEALRTGLGLAQTPCGEHLTATALQLLACDADVLPIALDGAGVPLDVGRVHRLVTPGIRAALDARDQGCAFPGCDRPPADCEAHHIRPWWAEGPTALNNLALLCPHHHRVVEPDRDGPWDIDNPHRWSIRIRDGLPILTPPALFDPTRRPRRHARFRQPVPV